MSHFSTINTVSVSVLLIMACEPEAVSVLSIMACEPEALLIRPPTHVVLAGFTLAGRMTRF